MIPTQAAIAAKLGVDKQSAQNVHALLRLANARGQAGRWPDQNFEHADDWQRDGYLIDRVALLADVEPGPVFELYCASHQIGLNTRQA
jgi:hypothetical protein